MVAALRAFGSKIGVIKSLQYYVDLTRAKALAPNLASELQTSAVTIFDTASNGRDGAASKMLLGRFIVLVFDSLMADHC